MEARQRGKAWPCNYAWIEELVGHENKHYVAHSMCPLCLVLDYGMNLTHFLCQFLST